MEQYFDSKCDLDGRDIGRSKEVRKKINKFKVWIIIYNYNITNYLLRNTHRNVVCE